MSCFWKTAASGKRMVHAGGKGTADEQFAAAGVKTVSFKLRLVMRLKKRLVGRRVAYSL